MTDKVTQEQEYLIRAHTLKLALLNDPQVRAQYEVALARWQLASINGL